MTRPVQSLKRRTCALAMACALSVLGALGLAQSAGAIIVHVHGGRALSYQPLRNAARGYDRVFSNLDYNGGPVMKSNSNYMLYWRPSTASAYPADYQTGINRYFADLAHDSGKATNVDSVATQYGDHTGNFANYKSTFAGALADADAYPANGCSEGKICITDTQIQSEINKYLTAHSLPRDLAHEYFVATPPSVVICMKTDFGDICSANATDNQYFCAYHGNTTSSPTAIYAVQPYVTNNPGCDDGNHPNGTTSDGALEGGMSHEHNESVTDPEPNSAWTDIGGFGGEDGDKCAGYPGPSVGTASNGALYNQVVNGHFYWYQQEWSNKGNTCLQRFKLTGSLPTAQFKVTPSTGAKLVLNATGSSATGGVAYYNWQPNDLFGSVDTPVETHGASTTYDFGAFGDPVGTKYNVALTVFGPDGVSRGISEIVKSGDEGPVGSVLVTTTSPTHGVAVHFSGAGSSDSDGSISSYSWNFGDGATGTGATPTHTYTAAGRYPITLTVKDSSGLTAVVAKNLTVS